jgi:hypothetical protein
MTKRTLALVAFSLLAALPAHGVIAQASPAGMQVVSTEAPGSPVDVRLGRIFENGAGQRFFAGEIRNRGNAAITSLVLRLVRVGADGNVRQSQGKQVTVNVAPGADDLVAVQLTEPPLALEDGDRVVALVAEASGFGGPVWRLDPARARDIVLDAVARSVRGFGR